MINIKNVCSEMSGQLTAYLQKSGVKFLTTFNMEDNTTDFNVTEGLVISTFSDGTGVILHAFRENEYHEYMDLSSGDFYKLEVI